MAIVACLDACVLVPALLRDLLLESCDFHAFKPIWSTTIQEEFETAIRRIHTLHGLDPDETNTYLSKLATAMNATFPFARQEFIGHQMTIDPSWLPDPNDAHVIEATRIGNASVIVTFNTKDFPIEALPSGLTVQHPDDFLVELVKDNRIGQSVLNAIASISERSGRKGPLRTERQIVTQLDQLGLSRFAIWASSRVRDQ